MRSYGLGTDPSLLSEVIAMLVLRGQSDELRLDAEDRDRLRTAFPDGFALVAYGDPETDGDLRLRVLGRESLALLEDIYAELADGETTLLERLFNGRRRGP